MPARIGQGASNRFGNLVTSTEKLNNQTYDMNDEECTDNSAEVSDSMSTYDPSFPIRDQMKTLESSLLQVTQAAASSQTQARGIRSHLESHIDASTGHQISLDLDSAASKVSWSDSDGSTYESEQHQDQKGSLGSTNSMDNLGTPIAHSEKSPSSKALSNPRMPETTKIKGSVAKSQKVQFDGSMRTTTKDGSPRLEHVDYYSYIDVATTNDGLSSVGFISKEDTRPIFCRRIVPLEIPVQWRPSHDDISAFSSCDPPSVMPTGDSMSVQAVHTRRATVQQPRETTLSIQNKVLNHVDYLPNIDLDSDNHDISTITCRISGQDAASALNDKQHEDRKLVALTIGPLEGQLICSHLACHNRIDSISTLGSASVTSVASEARLSSFDAYDDTGSSTKSTPTKSVKPLCDTSSAKNEISPFSHTSKYSKAQSCDLEHSLHAELPHQSQETTNQRIQNLKAKIKQMQVASTMENLPDTRKILPTLTESSARTTKSSKSTSRIVGTTMRNDRARQAPKEEDTRKPQRSSRLHVLSRENDVQRRFQIQDKDRSASTHKNTMNSESSLSHEKRGEVPSVVTPLAHDGDDISTIHCDVPYSGSKDFVDVELEGALNGPKYSGQIPGVVDRSFRAFATTVNSLARNANTLLEHYAGYHRLKSLVTRIWMKYVQGRSRTEQAILGVILLSFSILFILVISLISG